MKMKKYDGYVVYVKGEKKVIKSDIQDKVYSGPTMNYQVFETGAYLHLGWLRFSTVTHFDPFAKCYYFSNGKIMREEKLIQKNFFYFIRMLLVLIEALNKGKDQEPKIEIDSETGLYIKYEIK